MQPLVFFIFPEKYRCEKSWSTTPRFISFLLRAFWSMILWRKRSERKYIVHEFPVWNVHEAHGWSTAVGSIAPSRTQTIILQVVDLPPRYGARPERASLSFAFLFNLPTLWRVARAGQLIIALLPKTAKCACIANKVKPHIDNTDLFVKISPVGRDFHHGRFHNLKTNKLKRIEWRTAKGI